MRRYLFSKIKVFGFDSNLNPIEKDYNEILSKNTQMKQTTAIIVILIVIVNALIGATQFINFVQFYNRKCESFANSGSGFSVVPNQCIDNEFMPFNYFVEEPTSTSVLLKIYDNSYCQDSNLVYTNSYTMDTCTTADYDDSNLEMFYQITESSTIPPMLNGTLALVFTNSSNDIIAQTYYGNNTFVYVLGDQSQTAYNYYCDGPSPYFFVCNTWFAGEQGTKCTNPEIITSSTNNNIQMTPKCF
ncbi:hypothetical protein DLAC_11761 [Tieghemostelium lacteum]|uniref:Transmembrane protein n=1 Tax=Tieghemostelium lacteum TaxID=361077 RepID=A0A151Z9G9_TIELA|nr:hypothetical protein DLAC_11761 [Tieghemostelium lacteum]|eukprot:KYQ90514.1 hypothetical protein DLAC_11761 [Tieghemostelium lacteum]